jgi:mannose-6-phosphate isomerase-like protein (cupin superfamily)
MPKTQSYIESGILEAYVLGSLSESEILEVESIIAGNKALLDEIEKISESLESFARLNAIEPDPTIKPFLLATIDYSERLENGEAVTFPPALNESSTIGDFSPWLSHEDMVLVGELESVHAKIIGYTPEQITAIVWIKKMAPEEIHTNEFERFLIVEGSCDIQIGETVHQLQAGDFLSIPLFENHFVTVTSSIPCKVILQRVAA